MVYGALYFSTGSVTRGSKANLITAVQTGSPLRLVVHETTDSYSKIEADHRTLGSCSRGYQVY